MKSGKKTETAKKEVRKSPAKEKSGKQANGAPKKNGGNIDTDFHHEHPFRREDTQ